MKFTVLTLFPEMIASFASQGLLGQAARSGRVQVDTLNPRQFTQDVHKTVDDRAFGPGDGMVMKVVPLRAAVATLSPETRLVVLSPQGRLWNQAEARAWAAEGRPVALVCGRYAGIDQRFTVLSGAEEISIGDYVLNGGEIAACAVIESVARLLPGVLGNALSAQADSFSAESEPLECPQFTRPREVEGLPVPEPLLSGHHAKIAEFQTAVSRVRTALLRPDLAHFAEADLSRAARQLNDLSDLELRAIGVARASLRRWLE